VDVRVRRSLFSLDQKYIKSPAPNRPGGGGQFLVASEGPATVPAFSLALARLLARSKPPQRVCHLSSPAETRAILGVGGVEDSPS
jgi:hypothetical protein